MTTNAKRLLPLLTLCVLALVPAAAQGALLSNAATSPGKATGAVVEAPGLLVVGKSATSQDDAKVTAINVAGIELLGHQDGTHRGALAPLGGVLDSINEATCPNGFDNPDEACFLILHMNTREVEDESGSQRESNVVVLGTNSRASGLKVAGSDAVSQYDATQGDCSDAGSGFVLTGQEAYVPDLQNDLLHSQSLSFDQPCAEEAP